MRVVQKYIVLLILVLFSAACRDSRSPELKRYNLSLNTVLDSVASIKYPKRAKLLSLAKLELQLNDLPNDSTYRNLLYRTSRLYFSIEEDSLLESTARLLLRKSIEKKDSLNIAKAYNLIGNKKINVTQNDSAFYFLLKAEKLFLRIGDSLSLANNYVDKAFVQLYESDYSGCELSCIQALSYYKGFEVPSKQYDAYNLIGISSNELRNYDNALIYHAKALKVAEENNLVSKSHFKSNSLNNIGVVYQNLKNYPESIKRFERALEDKDLKTDTPSLYAMVLDNLAYSKMKLQDFGEVLELYKSSLTIRELNGFNSSVIVNKIHLSEYFLLTRDSVTSRKFADEALLLAKKTKVSGDLLLSLKQLSVVNPKEASRYSKEYIKLSDSLQTEERKARDKFARIQFETDEILNQKDKLAAQNRNLLYFFIATFLIGLLLFVIRNQRAKNRELLLVQAQQKANEEIYSLMMSQQAAIEDNRVQEKKRIARELHDGVLGRLFGARLNLDSLNKNTDLDAIEGRNKYLEELKNIEQDIREISHDLNREKKQLINNFTAIVFNLIEEQRILSKNTVLSFKMDEEINWDLIDNTLKINLYRILQEAVQNINKYAEATEVNVAIRQPSSNIINLTITDNGIGFDITSKKKGIGLQNIEARAVESNGDLKITSGRDEGTSINIDFKLF